GRSGPRNTGTCVRAARWRGVARIAACARVRRASRPRTHRDVRDHDRATPLRERLARPPLLVLPADVPRRCPLWARGGPELAAGPAQRRRAAYRSGRPSGACHRQPDEPRVLPARDARRTVVRTVARAVAAARVVAAQG